MSRVLGTAGPGRWPAPATDQWPFFTHATDCLLLQTFPPRFGVIRRSKPGGNPDGKSISPEGGITSDALAHFFPRALPHAFRRCLIFIHPARHLPHKIGRASCRE